jgi:hypothetical protein
MNRVLLFCALIGPVCVVPAMGAELVTDEALRLRVLRALIPMAQISGSHLGAYNSHKTANKPHDKISGLIRLLPLIDALENERTYDVTAPVGKQEESEASGEAPNMPPSGRRQVRLRLYRWHREDERDPVLVAAVNYTFQDANPPRCCRAIGKFVLLSNDGSRVLDSVDKMPNAFTMFTSFRFLDVKGNGSEQLIVGADFAGAFTVGVNTAIFDLSQLKLSPLMWTTTAVFSASEEPEMYTMTLDENRTRLAKARRYYFVKTTYCERGKIFTKLRRSVESWPAGLGPVELDWL